MSKPKPNLLLMLAIALFATAVVFEIAYGDNHKYRDDDGDVTIDNVLTGGDNSNVATNSMSGGRSYGASHSLGDVDLNQCMGSTQWGSIIISRQKLVLNKWCAGESYDAKRMFKMAALLRCDIPEISKHFIDKAECVKENTATLHVEPPDEPKRADRDDEYYDRLYARIADLEAKAVQDKATAEKAAKSANAMAQRVAKTAQIAQQAPDDAAERRAKAREALRGEE